MNRLRKTGPVIVYVKMQGRCREVWPFCLALGSRVAGSLKLFKPRLSHRVSDGVLDA